MPKTPPEEPKEPKEPRESKPKADTLAPRRYVEKTALNIMRWSPVGGSGWLFVHAVRTQDWLMALILFPVTVVYVVWAKYTEGFTEKIGEIYQGRGSSDAEGIVKGIDSGSKALREAIAWRFSRFDQIYLECQINQHQIYKTDGFKQPNLRANLEDVFVRLEISGNFYCRDDGQLLPMQPGLRSHELEQIDIREFERLEELNIWQLLADSYRNPALKQMAILAYGGYGKTTLLRHITYVYATGKQEDHNAPNLIPVLLYLRQWKEVIATETQLTLPELITKYCQDLVAGKEVKIPPSWAKKFLQQGKMLVMFDGFDEVNPEWRLIVSQWITKQMRLYDQSIFILTSRPGGYNDNNYSAEKPKVEFSIKPFNRKQQQEFINKWYLAQAKFFSRGENEEHQEQARYEANKQAKNLIGQIEQQQELAAMAINPLLLNMIAFYHSSRSGQKLPPYRAGLYREICKLQLGDRPIFRDIDLLLDVSESQQVLQELALGMMEQNLASLEKEQLIQVLQPKLQAIDDTVDTEKFIKEITDISELLVEAEKDEYEFAHLTFQAFLAAEEIKRLKREDFLVEKWEESWWKDTILFYAGLMKNPNILLQKLLNKGNNAVSLVDACRKNTARKIDPNIDTQIHTLRYEKLEGFLNNGQWREADEETYRVMIEVLDKEEGDYFRKEDLLKFPCEDLVEIDRLWLKYSQINGVSRFGFSVQKEIIKKCGYKLDGSDPPSEVWYDFLDKVGWRDKKTQRWQDPTYTLDVNTKEGTLPLYVRRGTFPLLEEIRSVRKIVSLFSRIETCRL